MLFAGLPDVGLLYDVLFVLLSLQAFKLSHLTMDEPVSVVLKCEGLVAFGMYEQYRFHSYHDKVGFSYHKLVTTSKPLLYYLYEVMMTI